MVLQPRQILLEIYQQALTAVHGRACVRAALQRHPCTGPVYVIAIGKAACSMVQGAYDVLRIENALIVTKRDHVESLPWPVLEAGHPLPDEQSIAAGQDLLDFANAIPLDANVLVLLSGGASVLVEVLPEGVSLAQLRELNTWLLASGLDIASMNRYRKQLSRIKGGRLARLLAPRSVLCLAISDVPNDDPGAMGSGLLVVDSQQPITSANTPPTNLLKTLKSSPVAPAADDPCFQNVRFEIIARLDDAKRAAAQAARELGYTARLHAEFVKDDALVAGKRLAGTLTAAPKGEIQIWGGETTIKLPAVPGRGGRNQSLALAAAQTLAGREQVWFLSAGTDGSDGPGWDAGALVDGGTVMRGEEQGLNVVEALANANAGTFLEASGDLIETGPTGTNVMDLMLGLRT